jgi:uncharacterized protein with GYD domain
MEVTVNTYVALINWTDQGIRQVKETVQRAEQVRGLAEQMGCRMPLLVWTMGRFDLVSVLEAPDDAAASAFALRVAGQGAVRLETFRAFTAEEMTGLLAKLG